MINSIPKNTDKSVFAPLQNNSAPYSVSKTFIEKQSQTDEEANEQKGHKFGLKIVTAALVGGFGALLLAKGAPKSFKTQVNNFAEKIENKILNLDKNYNRTKLENVYYGSLKNLKKVALYSQAIFNFSPLKDAPAQVFAKKFKPMKKVWNAISNAFEKVSVKTSKLHYSSTEKHFNSFYEQLDVINSKLPQEKAKGLTDRIQKIKGSYNNGFCVEARNKRLADAKKDMGNIDERFLNRTLGHPLKMFKDPKFYTTFISEEEASGAKLILNHKVASLKKQITFRVNDDYLSVKKLVNGIDLSLDSTNPESRKTVQDLYSSLEKYKKTGDAINKKNLITNLENLDKHVAGLKDFDKEKAKNITKQIEMLKNSDNGEIQKLMNEYKKLRNEGLISSAEYLKLEKKTNKALNSLDKSINVETDKLFDKIRDIQIGSAPMDVLGILTSFGIVGWWLGKAENKEERISAALKYGIPAIGAVAISTLCTVGLVSGGPALIIGLASGRAINILGSYIDKKRKQYKEQPLTLADAAKIPQKIKNTLSEITS